MNALVTQTTNAMVPSTMGDAIRLAEMMAKGKMMPQHLQNPGDALMVVEQAMRWNMSPFAVAQSTFNIKGKLLFAGTIVAAAIENSGAIQGLMDYQFSGEGLNRKITVSAIRKGETEPRTVEVILKDAKTENQIWNKQPDQQLVYHGARVWARRWTPGVMLGVYTPEEWHEQPAPEYAGTTIDTDPTPIVESPRKPTVTDWLNALDIDLQSALTSDAVDAIIARPDVQKAQDKLQGAARDRLNEIVSAAIQRTAPAADEDVFPGDIA